ncbi:SpoIIE family protein phosphatase [Streptomyces sp. Tue6028]|uniref:SpoIIE family protein phosphatase n=1 Tax=Streptomyces sp. Tue6028 TaxID=2036037 RepID=UPI003D7455D6
MLNGDVLMRVDESGRVIEWNRPAQELFGWSTEEAVGQFVTALVDEAAADEQWRRARVEAAAPVLVKPVLTGSSVVWEVRAAGDAPSGQDVAILRAMFTQSPVGLHVLDDQLRILRMNTATRALRDAPTAQLLGRVFTEAYQLAEPEQEEAAARRVLESGRPALDRLVRGVSSLPGQTRSIYSVSYVRLENARGDVLGLVASAVDVTARERALQRLSVLDAVRKQVGEHLDVITVCEELVKAVVPAFTGIAVVEVIEDVVRGQDPPLVPVDRDVPLRRAAFRGQMSAYPVGDVRRLPYGTPFARVLSDLRPRLLSVEEDSMWLSADLARADAIRQSGVHSLIVAPLALRGEALGVVSFYRQQGEEPFVDEDMALVADVCAHAALCIDNARRYARERTIAATVQRRLLPQQPEVPSTLDFSHLHLPGLEGGGAWFDVISLVGARTALIVGEVAGRGIAAATTMGQLRTVINSLFALDLEPDDLMARLNDTAARLAAERGALPAGDPLHREPLTAGCLIAIYDPVELTCTIVRAGLPEPVAVLADGSSTALNVPAGPLLAGTGNAPFPATTVALPAGSTLVIGTAALAEKALSSSAPLRPLLDDAAGQNLADLCDTLAYALREDDRSGDALVLLARTKALPSRQILSRSLPADPEAAPLARAAVRRQLRAWNVGDEDAFTTELIASELVGNAVRYGAAPIRLRLIRDRALTCEVSDASTSAPHVKHARTIDETGRGLFIVATLADSWGTHYHTDGKTVWAQQHTSAQPTPAPGEPSGGRLGEDEPML